MVQPDLDQLGKAFGDMVGRADDTEAIDEIVGKGGFVACAAGRVGCSGYSMSSCE